MSLSGGPTPRMRVRLLSRGRAVAPPLLLPLVHALAAEIEALAPRDFLANPTKLAKGPQALHQALETDGIVCGLAAGLEVEAAGAELDWTVYPPRVVSHPASEGILPQSVLTRIPEQPRVSAALEATRRLASASAGEPVLVALLAGPASLAGQLGGPAFASALAADLPEARALIEQAARIALELARQFCQAGAQVVVLREETLPAAGSAAFEAWQAATTPIVNVVRFHQALPALVPPALAVDQARTLTGQPPGNALVCRPAGALPPDPAARPIGLALPALPTAWTAPGRAYSLVTTAGEVSLDSRVADLRAACQGLRASLRE